MVKLAEGNPVIVPAGIEQDFKITPAQLEAAITPKTKALILCSPSNPTGSVYSAEELAGLAEVLKNIRKSSLLPTRSTNISTISANTTALLLLKA